MAKEIATSTSTPLSKANIGLKMKCFIEMPRVVNFLANGY